MFCLMTKVGLTLEFLAHSIRIYLDQNQALYRRCNPSLILLEFYTSLILLFFLRFPCYFSVVYFLLF
jgi:hypothetical protein